MDHDGHLGMEELLSHRDFVRRLARGLLADSHSADDIEQETWVRVLEHPRSDVRSPRRWLSTVVRNLVRSEKRREQRRTQRHQQARLAEPETPEAAMRRQEVTERLLRALLSLDAPARQVVMMRFFDDQPPREIARILELPVETVRTRIKRALAKLRQRLDGDGSGDWRGVLLPVAGLATISETSVASAGVAATAPPAAHVAGYAAGALALVTAATVWWIAGEPELALEKPRASSVKGGAAMPPAGSPDKPTSSTARAIRLERQEVTPESEKGTTAERAIPAAADPAADGLVSGRVLSSGGTPIERAKVKVSLTGTEKLLAETETNAAGQYVLEELPVNPAAVVITAASEGYTEYRIERRIPVRGRAIEDLDLMLYAARDITGTVRDENGEPVQGAWVWLFGTQPGAGGRFDDVAARKSDDEGRFRFDKVPLGSVQVLGWKAGHARAWIDVSGDEDVEVPLPRAPSSRLMIRIEPLAGDPVPEIPIRVASSLPDAVSSAVPDREGRAELKLPPGDYEVRLGSGSRPERYFEPTEERHRSRFVERNGAHVKVEPDEMTELIFVEVPPLIGHGILTTTSGKPVAGQTLICLPRRKRLRPTDAVGRFTFPHLPEGGALPGVEAEFLRFELEGDGYVLNDFGMARVNPGETVRLTAVQPVTISGRVIGVDGTPQSRTVVELLRPDRRGGGLRPAIACDLDGRFRLRSLPFESARLVAKDRRRSATLELTATTEGDGVEDLELVLEPRRVTGVSGRVIDANQEPVAGCGVIATLIPGSSTEKPSRLARGTATTDHEGRWRLEELEPPGKYSLDVQVGSVRRTVLHELELDEGADVKDVELVFRSGKSIGGRVLTPEGEPLAGIRVDALRQDEVDGTLDLWVELEATSDSRGRFRIEGLREGLYTLQVTEPVPEVAWRGRAWTLSEPDVPAGSDDVTIRFRRRDTGTIVGKVEPPRGEALGGILFFRLTSAEDLLAQSAGRSGGDEVGRVDLDPDSRVSARFRIDHLPEGSYELELGIRGARSISQPVRIAAHTTLDLGTVRFERAGLVRGVVTDASGRPLMGASLACGRPAPTLVQTDDEGRFECFGMRSEPTEVTVWMSGFATLRTAVARDDAESSFVFRLEKEAAIRCLTDPGKEEGMIVAEALALIGDYRAMSGDTFGYDEGRSGVTQLDLPPGRYRVTLDWPRAVEERPPVVHEVTVGPGETKEIDLRIR